jgi:preprotein translocase subunit SecA
LTEYKREAFDLFEKLIQSIYDEVTHLILKVEIGAQPEIVSSPIEGSGVIMRGGDEAAAAGTFSGSEAKNLTSRQAEGRAETVGNNQAQGPKSVRKVGRNDPCPCGSGKKYKKCCGR